MKMNVCISPSKRVKRGPRRVSSLRGLTHAGKVVVDSGINMFDTLVSDAHKPRDHAIHCGIPWV